MSQDTIDRRSLLAIAGTATATALAGCIGGAPNAANQASGGQTAAPSADDHEEEEQHSEESEGGHHEEESGHAEETEGGHHEEESTHAEETEGGHHEEGSGHAEETAADHHEEEEHHGSEATHTEGGHSGSGPVGHAEVAMETTDGGHHFHPHVAWVEPGGTVTFVNESGTHTATAYHPDNDRPQRIPDGAESFDSGLLTEQGATFEHTFETEGVYDVYCAPHEQLGMIGTVVVGEPDPHDQPGLAEPQDGMSEAVASKLASLNEQVNTMLGHEH